MLVRCMPVVLFSLVPVLDLSTAEPARERPTGPFPSGETAFRLSARPGRVGSARRASPSATSGPRKPTRRSNLRLDKATFWQALDAIARELRKPGFSPYQEGGVALVAGPFRVLPVSYSGPFRVLVKKVDLSRDLETGRHDCVVHLEIAWEPGWQAFLVDTGPGQAVFPRGGEKNLSEIRLPGKDQVGVEGRPALEVDLRPACAAAVGDAPGTSPGEFAVVGSARMLTFSFDRLDKIDKPAQAPHPAAGRRCRHPEPAAARGRPVDGGDRAGLSAGRAALREPSVLAGREPDLSGEGDRPGGCCGFRRKKSRRRGGVGPPAPCSATTSRSPRTGNGPGQAARLEAGLHDAGAHREGRGAVRVSGCGIAVNL